MPGPQRELRPEVYLRAAMEHMPAAVLLDEQRCYVLAHYVAGLAVECVLRAFKSRLDAALDERHDLRQLARSGRFLDLVSGERQGRAAARLAEVVVRWDNSHRYRDEAALRRFLRQRRLNPRRGDALEHSSRMIVNAAIEVVSLGVERWKM